MTSQPMSCDAPKDFGAINPPFATTVDLLTSGTLSASRPKPIDIAVAATACENSGSPHAF